MANHPSDYGKMLVCQRGTKHVHEGHHHGEMVRPRNGYPVQPGENGQFVLRRHTPVRERQCGLDRLCEVLDEILAIGTEKEMDAKAAALMATDKAQAGASKETRKTQRKNA